MTRTLVKALFLAALLLPAALPAKEKTLPRGPTAEAPLVFTTEGARTQSAETLALVCQFALGAAHNAAFGAGLVAPDYFTGEALNVTTYILNLALKTCPPSLTPPKDLEYAPPAGQCYQDIKRDATRGRAANVLGTQLSVKPDAGDWSPNTRPFVFAWNTDVVVTTEFAPVGPTQDMGKGVTRFPVGEHKEVYRAENYASFWDYLYVPGLPLPKGAEKILGKAGVKFAEFALNVAIAAGLIAASLTVDAFTWADTPTGSINQQLREIAVLDSVAPEAEVTRDRFTIEALELGGASVLGITPTGQSNLDLLRSGFTIEDDCAPRVELSGPNPPFWPIGETTEVTWVGRDDGPNTARKRNATTVTQYVEVVDTLPPTVLAAPSRVVEADGDSAVVHLQPPRVFDFGDADPTIELEGQVPPETLELPLGQNLLEWRATDDFGNFDTDFQLINVKLAGTNIAPTAESRSADALTFVPQEIILRGDDPDADPLDFRIEQFPPGGGFEAPLLPYFIEDFRGNFEAKSTCDADRPWSELANPDHVLITDEGRSYVVDCHGGESRMVVFDADRNVLAGRALERNSSLNNGVYFVPGRNIILYTGQNGAAGVRLYLLDPDTLEVIRRYRHANPPSLYSGLSSFLVNEYDLMFLPDGLGNVRVLDLEASEQDLETGDWIFPEPVFTFQIDPLETAGGGFTVARDMVLNHDNEILFVTEGRVHKMSPSTRAADGTPVLGHMIGWIGACASGEGCDPERQASRGFSCVTGVTCQTGEALYFGEGPGQFNQTQSASVDRRNNIYVADWRNSRVQRFTDDGVFGGEAVSVCPPEQRCFLLGDFGRPSSVAVNSRNLYVFDKTTDVIHVFETSVIEPIDDETARVVYTANDGFTGADQFTFSSTDGLARSAPATVNIDVSRQFRPPSADRIHLTGSEDEPLSVRLSGTDPDGAVDLPLAYEIVEHPAVGSLKGALPELTFTAPQHWYGETSFTFRVSDGLDWSEPETVTLVIEPVNDAPVLEFVSIDTDDPDTFPLDVTAGYPVTFKFRYTDVDDEDLHRFDVNWTHQSPEWNLNETDVVVPSVDNASPLLVAGANEGEIVATWTWTEPFANETVRACLSDNVVLDNQVKYDSTTTLQHCIDVDVTHLARPELDAEIISPRLVPGQYDRTVVQGRVSNRPPEGDSLTGETARDVELELYIDGKATSNFAATLEPGGFLDIATQVDVSGFQVGDTVSVEVFTRNSNGEASFPSLATREIVVGPPGDIVVNASEGNASACRFECARDAASCPAAESQPVCTLSDALALSAAAPQDTANPVLLLSPGAIMLDEDHAPLNISGSLDIVGLGADRSSISGSGRFPLLGVTGSSVRLRDLSLNAGTTEGITKVANDPGTAVVEVFSGARLSLERAGLTGHVGEAVLRSAGELLLDQVSLEGNSMDRHLVEVVDGPLSLRNVSLLDNDISLSDELGLLGHLGGVVTLEHVTAAGNNAPLLYTGANAGFASISGSVLDGNGSPVCRDGGGPAPQLEGVNALSADSGCGAADITLQAEHLAPLRDAGGLSVRQPALGSPLLDALEAGDAACPDTDTLGGVRPLDGDGDGEARCDLGAVERLPAALLSSVTFDARASGDGFYLVADGDNLSAAFFGYGQAGEPMWLVGNAPLSALQPTLGGDFVLDMLESGTNGAFDAPQNPGADPLEPWGQVTFRFDDCNRGSAVLDGVHGSKVMRLDALVTADGCRATPAGKAADLEAPTLSAVFFDASASGDGFYLVDNGDNVSVAFFGYGADGKPLWLVGATPSADFGDAPGQTVVFDLVEGGPDGAFPGPQDPGADPLPDWGTLSISFDGCRRASAVLSGTDGEKSMTLESLVATGACGF